jgi:hypothetical protein
MKDLRQIGSVNSGGLRQSAGIAAFLTPIFNLVSQIFFVVGNLVEVSHVDKNITNRDEIYKENIE